MKVLVVSDTHGRDENLEKTIEIERPFDRIIHLGDICGSEDYLMAYADVPVDIVAGNNDIFTDLPAEVVTYLKGHKALLTHGHYFDIYGDLYDLIDKAKSLGADIAMHGHTHVPYYKYVDDVLLLNPGSLTYPRQMGREPSYIVLDIDDDGEIDVRVKYLSRGRDSGKKKSIFWNF